KPNGTKSKRVFGPSTSRSKHVCHSACVLILSLAFTIYRERHTGERKARQRVRAGSRSVAGNDRSGAREQKCERTYKDTQNHGPTKSHQQATSQAAAAYSLL